MIPLFLYITHSMKSESSFEMSSNESIVFTDSKGKINTASAKFVKFSGYSLSELMSINIKEIIHSTLLKKLIKDSQTHQSLFPEIQVDIMLKDNILLNVNLKAKKIQHPENPGVHFAFILEEESKKNVIG